MERSAGRRPGRVRGFDEDDLTLTQRGGDGFLRLVPVRTRHRLVLSLPVVAREVDLLVARLVRRDLGGVGAVPAVREQVLLNLLPARARDLEVLLRESLDLGLGALAPFNLIPSARRRRASSVR